MLLNELPDSGTKFLYLGKSAFAQEQLEQAEEYLEQSLELDGNSAEAHFMLGQTSMFLASNASIFSAPGYAFTAQESLEQAIKLDPKHTDAMVALAQFNIFAPSIVGGDIERAQELIVKVEQDSMLEALLLKRLLYRKQEQPEKLVEVAGQLQKDFSTSARALLSAGFIYQDQEDFDRAFDSFVKASTAQREDIKDFSPDMALYQIGKTAVTTKQNIEQGSQALKSYMKNDYPAKLPTKEWVQFRLAQLQHLQGEKEQALEVARKIKKSTDDDRLEDELGDFIKLLKKS